MRQRTRGEIQLLAVRFRESFRRAGYSIEHAASSAAACLRALGEKTSQPVAGAWALERQESRGTGA